MIYLEENWKNISSKIKYPDNNTEGIVEIFNNEFNITKSENYFDDFEQADSSDFENVHYLDLSRRNLEEIPSEISKFKNLKALDLSNNNISDYRFLEELTNLRILILKKQKLETVPSEISKLRKLICLDISQNNITYITTKIEKLRNLIFLDISDNLIRSFSHTLYNLENLVYLNASTNRINVLSREISKMKNLSHFDLSNNLLYEIPGNIHWLQNLDKFNLMSNRIFDLPNVIEMLQLRYLNIADNNFEKLPLQVLNIKTLTTFIYEPELLEKDNSFKEKPELKSEIYRLENRDFERYTIKLTYNTKKVFKDYFRHFKEYAYENNVKENLLIMENKKSLEIVKENSSDSTKFTETLSSFIGLLNPCEYASADLINKHANINYNIDSINKALSEENSGKAKDAKKKFIKEIEKSIWEQKFNKDMKKNKPPGTIVFFEYVKNLIVSAHLKKALKVSKKYFEKINDQKSLSYIVTKSTSFFELQRLELSGFVCKKELKKTKQKIGVDILKYILPGLNNSEQ